MMKNRTIKKALYPLLLSLAVSLGGLFLFGEEAGKPAGKRWRIEFSGGYNIVNPEHLNLINDVDQTLNNIFFSNRIRSDWGYVDESLTLFRPLKSTYSPEIRLIRQVNAFLSLSAGLHYSWGSSGSTVNYDYSYPGYFHEQKEFTRYSLSAQSILLDLGLHIDQTIGKVTLGAFAAAGPAFASFRHHKEWLWVQELKYYQMNQMVRVFAQEGEETLKGHGFSFVFQTGARIACTISSRLSWFILGQYVWQKVNRLTGSAERRYGDMEQSSQGRWQIKADEYIAGGAWQSYSYPDNQSSGNHMILDLSGFQLRLGLSLNL